MTLAPFAHLRESQSIGQDRAMRLWEGLEPRNPYDDWGMGLHQPEWVIKAHNAHQGKRLFILGTGPSLAKQADLLPRLATEETWTVNRARYAKDLLGFIPTHHSVTEPSPVLDWGRAIGRPYDFPEAKNRIAIHWFPVKAPGWLWVAKADDEIQVRWEGFHGLGDHLPPLPTAWASPLTVAQLACWLGFTEIYLLGVDTTQTGQAWDVEQGRTTQRRSVLSILESADRARCEMEKAGRVLVDCTPGGRMNTEGVLPYRELADVLA